MKDVESVFSCIVVPERSSLMMMMMVWWSGPNRFSTSTHVPSNFRGLQTRGHFDICSIAKKNFLWILIEEMDFFPFLHFQLGEKGQSYVHAWRVDFVKTFKMQKLLSLFKVWVENAFKFVFFFVQHLLIHCLSKDQACHHLNIKLCPVLARQ